MSGPILPVSNPNRDISVQQQHSSQSLHKTQTSNSSKTANQPITSSSSLPHGRRSISSIHSQRSVMAPVYIADTGSQKGGSSHAEAHDNEAWQNVEVTQAGIVDKPVNDTRTQQEEDERTGYSRLIGTSFDETGYLWPEIRKMKLLTIKTADELGIFKDLSKNDRQYQYSIAPGTYMRFVRSLFASQHRCLWPVFSRAQFADHNVDVAILDLDAAQQRVKPMQIIHDYEELRSSLKFRPSTSLTRFVLVEDLSPAMIEALGSELDLDPEFFADHIAGAEDIYVKNKGTILDDGRLNLHPTEFLQSKDYFSVTWKRKALQDLQNQATLRDVLAALNMKEGVNRSEQLGQLFNTDFTRGSNIWRGQDVMGLEYLPGVAVAAEERASIYFKTNPENEDDLTVIMLFDKARTYKTNIEDDRSVVEVALSFHTSRITHPRVSYQTFHKERRTYISTSSNWPTRVDFLSYLCLSLQPGRNNAMEISLQCPNTGFHRVSVILHYALTDWQGVFQGLDGVLDKIDLEMSVNTVLQDRIYGWRHILGALRKQLVNDKDKINATLQIIEEFGGNGCICNPTSSNSKLRRGRPSDVVALQKSYKELVTRVTNLIERTERTFAALMSSMSIVESQRAISQAESVNRVTELAFIFIPLSFAASIFGMDIQGWSEHFTPELWFAISGGLVGGAYLLRLFVRARVVTELSEQLDGSLRRFGNIEDNGPVPTFTFLKWVVWKLGPAAIGLGIVALGIVCMWKFVESFAAKVAVTVILSILAFVWCMGLYLWRSWDILFREWTQWMQRTQPKSGIVEKEKGKFLSRTTEAKLKIWRDLSWKDIFFPAGRKSTIKTVETL